MTVGTSLVTLSVLVLLLPYQWSRSRIFGGVAGGWTSILYTYTYGTGYERGEFDGLRRLQV